MGTNDQLQSSKDCYSIVYSELLDRREEIKKRLKEISLEDVVKETINSPTAGSNKSRKRSSKKLSTPDDGNNTTTASLSHTLPQSPQSLSSSSSSSPLKTTTTTTNSQVVSYIPKSIDTHQDFLMKEMLWLSADFQAERKRQISKAKKISTAIKQFHKTKEKRRSKELTDAFNKKRKLAAKIARDVSKGWWQAKIERVIMFKQKLDADQTRRKAMDQQLGFLVRQTEKYGESLSQQFHAKSKRNNSDTSNNNGIVEYTTIEEAMGLTQSDSVQASQALTTLSWSRSRRKQILSKNYTQMNITAEDEFYGESTTDDDQNEDYTPSSDENDDETTFLEAEEKDRVERRRKRKLFQQPQHETDGDENDCDNDDDSSSFNSCNAGTDPEEIRKLQEEGVMDIELVLKRLEQEAVDLYEKEQNTNNSQKIIPLEEKDKKCCKKTETESLDQVTRKSVTFVDDVNADTIHKRRDTNSPCGNDKYNGCHMKKKTESDNNDGNDADDDADASDVEDFDDKNHSGLNSTCYSSSSDESTDFIVDTQNDVDDETTIEAEEKLGREMSPTEEIEMLKRENEMSIEELRAIYFPDSNHTVSNGRSSRRVSTRAKKFFGDVSYSKTGNNSSSEESGNVKYNIDSNSELDKSLSNETEEKDIDDFVPDLEEMDDETTMEAEEKLGNEMSPDKEISLLQKESEIPIESLREMYAKMMQENGTSSNENDTIEKEASRVKTRRRSTNSIQSLKNDIMDYNDDEVNEEEFKPHQSEKDDETTIEAEEKLGREMSYEEEISMLKDESEIPIDELRKMYNVINKSQEEECEVHYEESESDADGEIVTETLSEQLDSTEDVTEDDEFHPDSTIVIDDETTLEQEEKYGQDVTFEEKLSILKKESEIPLKDLNSMYIEMENTIANKLSNGNGKKRRLSQYDSDVKDTAKKHKKVEHENIDDEGSSALQKLEAADDKARHTMVCRPFVLAAWVKLRLYQQIGLNWLVSIQSRRLNGILADEMGLGKTLQTISLLSYLACYKGIWGPHLVIVPTSCIVNWEMEIKRFCPSFKVLCYYGSAKRRKELRQGWTKTNWHHIVITSYQLAVQDSFAFKRKKWYYLILDEAQNIKNFQSQRWQTLVNFNTQRRLLLTGTPLQNNLMELWSLLHFLMPHVFRSRKEFSYWFSNPMNSIIEGNVDRDNDLIGRLHGIIRPFVLRRLKKDVETQMPGKFEHIVECQLSRRQMFLYEEFMARSSTRQALQNGGNFMGMMTVLMQLRKVCNHPDLFEPRSVITPFYMEGLKILNNSYTIKSMRKKNPLECISSYLIYPLWSLGCGVPSLKNVMHFDTITVDQLQRLQTPREVFREKLTDEHIKEAKADSLVNDGLFHFVQTIWDCAKEEKIHNLMNQSNINSIRCNCMSFPLSDVLLRSVKVDLNFSEVENEGKYNSVNIASTPNELLSLRRSQQQRADDLDDMIKKFVFCVPKAGSRRPSTFENKFDVTFRDPESDLMKPIETYFRPFRKAKARLSSFFPDKKLVQFDAGKLQTLSELLRNLKFGGHRALIFTQMSKMLDILEAFLNLNGHTYLRLDGSTSVDQRQRLMDRFNNDTKIFCFILSTRSGGLGINLTGADSVIFYDSDWNPAMDAQAQDRAHRIGQTRDVHIYRLVTKHTIEENILMKAKQKRQLDFLVMDEGKFHAAPKPQGSTDDSHDNNAGIFTKGKLESILGVEYQGSTVSTAENIVKEDDKMTKEQLEQAMASLEDEDDVLAMQGAQKEAAEQLEEFDETIQLKKDEDEQGDHNSLEDSDTTKDKSKTVPSTNGKKSNLKEKNNSVDSKDNENKDEALELEYKAWRNQIEMGKDSIDTSLSPVERYALKFKEEVDPFYSDYFISKEQQEADFAIMEEEWNVDEIESEKLLEEDRVMEEGDLLATYPPLDKLPYHKQLYLREKSRLRANKKRRKLTGENWINKIDGRTKLPFFYNEDTGEAVWEKPKILLELEADQLAHEKLWNAMPLQPLVNVMDFLIPYPDRMTCAAVCKQFRLAAQDISFVKHVFPVEMGAMAMDPDKMERNQYRTISEALKFCLPGDTLELGDGHYWVNEPNLTIDFPLRIVGDEKDPSHVIIELSGTIFWKAKHGWMEGVTLRRPKILSNDNSPNDILRILDGGVFDMFHCVLDNEGHRGNVSVLKGLGTHAHWKNVIVRGDCSQGCGILLEENSVIELENCVISNSSDRRIICRDNGKVIGDISQSSNQLKFEKQKY